MESGYWSLLAERKQQMPRGYPPEVRRQVIELARAGTKVRQLAATFRMSDATIYSWLKQDRIDRGEAEGATTSQQLELAAARRPRPGRWARARHRSAHEVGPRRGKAARQTQSS
jgi:transposase-like protein